MPRGAALRDETEAELASVASSPPLLGDTERFRHPLTALVVLAPLAILAEIYRFLSERKARLLAEDRWHELGGLLGVEASLLPALLLVAGCLMVQIVGRYRWQLPSPGLVLMMLAWGLLWAGLRYLLSFTSISLLHAEVLVAPDLDRMEALAQVGLATSGAIQEELLFRGALLGGLCLLTAPYEDERRLLSTWIAVPLQAVIFALAHTEIINHGSSQTASLELLVVHGVGGLLYGLVFVRQGLAVCTLAHIFYNVVITFGLGPW